MNLPKLVAVASDKANFNTLQDYLDFTRRYLDFVFGDGNLQTVIVSQNDHLFCRDLWQWVKKPGNRRKGTG